MLSRGVGFTAGLMDASAGLYPSIHLSTEPFRRPAAVQDPLRTWHALGDPLYLRSAGSKRRRARVPARFRDHDPDRNRDQGRAQAAPVALLGLDPAALSVLRVVQRRHCIIKTLGDLVRDRFRHAWIGEDDEVVATHVARKVSRRIVGFEDLEDDRGEGLDHVIAAQEPVWVVLPLESIDFRL